MIPPNSPENENRPIENDNITQGHVRAYHAITSGLYDNISLASCSINGERGVAIIMLDHVGENKVAIMPLFVAITPSMKIIFQGQGESGSGGGSKRPGKYGSLKDLEPLQPGGAK
ncbi:hypothetical protein [Hyphomicrobium sp.]|jgi:hypothetical protein|uniref:hypothetical protein n=1 Tax=Hyphomicrobium sp. TaxID=82 RepID=UPI0035617A19